ncbi:flagellar hook-length control protein FliK [Colwellia sp. 1_MG-2023]|uniref:flagellar hook-length control protein FliK n=1 Tax=unclassified Colwellia TaxID=196834 RepID=UPI001C09EEA2|nr:MULTISPECIES: flagellar hook-length control protein FliK [unclassified Colwellia]MBU2925294.1 flagellar hook-length control protein FliK [Colwellia sp. C2M11]MDO6664396.1 flagellar hook-length control protein FliK [Colwellia sp. 2_MG-2023]MDO6688491.1 flagellar hook-length control protein FliK [Colwellia sp. 1_MG-2023]
MQQLNVLSMKVSQGIENKDDAGALNSASPKDKFSQHIDIQLSKNKQHTKSENNPPNDRIVSNEKASSKTSKPAIEQKNISRDDKIQDRSEYHQAVVDNADPATNMQEVAALGNQDEPDTSIVNADDKKIVDESELLMTFLTKVDQTLVTEASSDKAVPSIVDASAVNVNEMPDEKTTKLNTETSLKNKGLSTGLSSVAKAVSSTTEVGTDAIQGPDKLINSLISEDKNPEIGKGSNINENIMANQASSTLLIDGESPTDETLATEKLVNSAQDKVSKGSANNLETDLTKLAEKNVMANNKIAEQVEINPQDENTSPQKFVDTAIASQSTIPVGTEVKSDNLQQNLMTASKEVNPNNISGSVREVLGTSIGADDGSDSEVKSTINEKLMKTDNGVSVLKNELTTAEVDTVVESSKTQSGIVKNNDNLTSQVINKNAVPTNLGQASVASSMEEASTFEPEEVLNEQSIDKLIGQNKIVDADGNKSVNNKASTTADIIEPNNRSNFIGEASKTTQDAYDRVEQQSSDALALTANGEVVQSQKTNIQLHQETISIFRRDFADAVKDKVMLVISQKLQQFDITLDPPELGNVQVRVNLQGEQATVNFVVQNQQAKEAFEQNMHKLRDLLAEQGVDVGDANVEQQSQQSDAEASSGGNHSQFSQNTADASDVVEHSLSARISDTSTKVIDYYA